MPRPGRRRATDAAGPDGDEPSIRWVPGKPLTAPAPSRRPPVRAVLALVVAVVALSVAPSTDAASKRVTVTAALQRLEQSGAITEAVYRQYEGVYVAAKTSLRRLSGTRRQELGAVLANVEAMAAKGQLIPSRLPVVFTTVERNRQWWTTQALPGGSQRVSFTGSRLVWEYYPGQGIEIQWLGTFGEANGYYNSHQTTALREVLSEAIALATRRAGGIAWEYMFQFDGGLPPGPAACRKARRCKPSRARTRAPTKRSSWTRPKKRSASSRRTPRRVCACQLPWGRTTSSTHTPRAIASSTASSKASWGFTNTRS